MFEKHLEVAREQKGVWFSQQAIVLIHYCVTRGIKVIVERSEGPEPMEADDIAVGMYRQLKALEKGEIKVDEANVNPDLNPLIVFIADSRGVKMSNQAVEYTNKLVDSATRLVVVRSATIASDRKREAVELQDVDTATRDIFGQGWFGW